MRKVLLALLLLLSPSQLQGQETSHRGLRVGASFGQLLSKSIQAEVAAGTRSGGLLGVYEFLLSPRFALGIQLEYRMFPGSPLLHQMGYGLQLKHGFLTEAAIRPYLEYGLLLNVTRLGDRSGAGTAHDTRLTGGVDFDMGSTAFFADASYHYTRLSFFESSRWNLDYLEITSGVRVSW